MVRLALIVGLLFSSVLQAQNKKISIGVLPGGSPKTVEKESFLMAEKLQNKLGHPVEVYISKDYTGMIEAMKKKRVDFAVLSSLTYVAAESEVPLKVLLKKTWNNGPFYYATILVANNRGISSIKSLKNKNIAFVDEKSTSGYLYPRMYLQKQGLQDQDFKSVVYSGNHAASVQMLEDGKVDAIAVFADDEKAKTNAWTRFTKNKKKPVKALWVSDPIPNDPIVVLQSFYDENPKLTHEVMYNLIEIQSESGQQLSEVLGSSELMPATARQYDPVREVRKNFQKKLNL